MSLLKWLRGESEGPSSTPAASALVELEANLSAAKRQQIENLETLEALREEEGTGEKNRRQAIDLESGVADLRH